jgi:uridine kinase
MKPQPKLIAIVGGSGAGKTWLARQLEQMLNPDVSRLSLDDFYCDRAMLNARHRESVNYDHPRAIDWTRVESVLRACRAGKPARVPHYDFATHTRTAAMDVFSPTPVVLVDGLWLLLRPQVRSLFHFSVYLDCPAELRLERRIARDVVERGRKTNSILQQFWKDVAPMHDRFVAPQVFEADIVLKHSPEPLEVENLAETIRALVAEDDPPKPRRFLPRWPIATNSRALLPKTTATRTNLELPVSIHQN